MIGGRKVTDLELIEMAGLPKEEGNTSSAKRRWRSFVTNGRSPCLSKAVYSPVSRRRDRLASDHPFA